MRVPYRVVGLVVGPKGATIKRIQQQTSTYIVTPSREKEPIFEVTGMPDNVEQAKREIEAHIALRTGLVSVDGSGNELVPDLHANNMQHPHQHHDLSTLNSLNSLNSLNGLGLQGLLGSNGLGMDTSLNSMATSDLMNSLYKAPSALRTAFASAASLHNDASSAAAAAAASYAASAMSNMFAATATTSNLVDYATPTEKLDNELQTLGSGLLNSLYDSDEGIGLGGSDSPTLSHSLIQPNIWSTDFGLGNTKRSNSFGFAAPAESEGAGSHPPARRISSDPLTAIGSTLSSLSAAFQIRNDGDSGVLRDSSASASASGTASPVVSPVGSSSNSSTRGSLKRECILCCEGEMVAALVPCGHKLFCMDCAQRLVQGQALPAATSPPSDAASGQCPVCHQPVTQAIRIFS